MFHKFGTNASVIQKSNSFENVGEAYNGLKFKNFKVIILLIYQKKNGIWLRYLVDDQSHRTRISK